MNYGNLKKLSKLDQKDRGSSDELRVCVLKSVVRFSPNGRPGSMYAGQKKFVKRFDDPALKVGFLSSGVQYGKTAVGAYILGKKILTQKQGPAMSWIIGPTFRYAERARTEFMRQWAQFIVSFNRARNEIYMIMPEALRPQHPRQKYYIVQVRSADTPEHLKSEPIYCAWMDEAPLCAGQAFENMFGRTLHSGGQIILTGTPRPIESLEIQPWIIEKVIEPFERGDKEYFVLYTSTEDAPPFQSPEGKAKLEQARRALGPDRYAMEYEGKYIRTAVLMFPEFNIGWHVIPRFALPQGAEIFAGIDFGSTDPCAVVYFAYIKDRLYAVDEIYMAHHATSGKELATAILKHPLHEHCQVYYGDPSGKSEILAMLDYGIYTVPAEKNYGLNYEFVRGLLKGRDSCGLAKLSFFDGCVNTVREFSRCHVPPGGLKKVRGNHAIDACHYALYTHLAGRSSTRPNTPGSPYEHWRGVPRFALPPSIEMSLYGEVTDIVPYNEFGDQQLSEHRKVDYYGEYADKDVEYFENSELEEPQE